MKVALRLSEGVDLKQLRLDADMTQQEVAESLGYASTASISQFENGGRYPSAEVLFAMLELYGYNVIAVRKIDSFPIDITREIWQTSLTRHEALFSIPPIPPYPSMVSLPKLEVGNNPEYYISRYEETEGGDLPGIRYGFKYGFADGFASPPDDDSLVDVYADVGTIGSFSEAISFFDAAGNLACTIYLEPRTDMYLQTGTGTYLTGSRPNAKGGVYTGFVDVPVTDERIRAGINELLMRMGFRHVTRE